MKKNSEKGGTECFHSRFPLLILLYARYSEKLIKDEWVGNNLLITYVTLFLTYVRCGRKESSESSTTINLRANHLLNQTRSQLVGVFWLAREAVSGVKGDVVDIHRKSQIRKFDCVK